MSHSDYSNLRILLAEDGELNQQFVTIMLEDTGITLDIAHNGQEALAMSGDTDYDIILMDMVMPEMDGLTATTSIREREKQSGKHTVIIALTANNLASELEACIMAGMDDFLIKPFSVEDMLRKFTLIPESASSSAVDEEFYSQGDNMETDAAIDVASLSLDLGEESAFKLLGLFVETGKKNIDEIKKGIEIGDLAMIKLAAHKLKGTASQYRAPGIVSSADKLLSIDNGVDLKVAVKDFNLLKAEFKKATDIISGVIEEKL